MRKDVIKRHSDPKSLCRERLRRLLTTGRKGELILTRSMGLLATAFLLMAVAEWVIRDSALSSAPEPRFESFLSPAAVRSPMSAPLGDSAEDSLAESSERTVETTLKKGDCLSDLLAKEGIPGPSIQELAQAIRPVLDLRRLPEGRSFTLTYDERSGQILRFESLADDDHLLVVERTKDGLKGRKEAFHYEVRPRTFSGTIRGSLFKAAEEAGLPVPVILSLIEIFDYDIDFHVDLRQGDTFQVLLEEKYLDGQFVRAGRILAARLESRGKPFYAFRFQGRDGRADYYDREGRSLRKTFLKSPLKYTRVSSTFSQSRLHPILGIYRPHLGVDYAAPAGTPVRAVSDGRITYAGWEGGFGNYVKIQHNGTFISTYGHLQRFADGIRTGMAVRQGQLLGYVGATGLATGPHLDFRLLKGGQFVDPLKVNFINAEPVSKAEMASFRQLVAQRVSELEKGLPALAKANVPRRL